MAEIADPSGATGIEILGESNICQLPEPARGVGRSMVGGLWRSTDCSPPTTARGSTSACHAVATSPREEGAENPPQRHLRLASTLGFSTIRPKFGVVSMGPGPAPDLGAASSRPTSTSPPSGTSSSARRSTPRPHQAPGRRRLHRLHRTDRLTALPPADRHRDLPARGDDAIHRGSARRPQSGVDLPPRRADDRPDRCPPHVAFIQAKFFDIDDDLYDPQIPWVEIIQTLVDARLERMAVQRVRGRREPYRGQEQVRRHHALLRRALRSRESRSGASSSAG